MIATVSQMTVDEAKAQALEAKRAYFLPKPIEGAGGMPLCWEGRIMRGMELAEQATQNQQPEMVKRMRDGLERVQAEMDAARLAMDQAVFAYFQLCDRADVAPESLEVGECNCIYCERTRAGDALWAVESRLRAAVFQLTEPDQDHGGLPLPLAYLNMGAEGEQKAWDLIIELANAQGAYLTACKRRERLPQWGYILRAW